MSDTPRTDANVVRGFDALRITNDEDEWVKATVARQLERENGELLEELVRMVARFGGSALENARALISKARGEKQD